MRRLNVIAAATMSLAAASPVTAQQHATHEPLAPAGSVLMVRLLSTISTSTHHAGSRFEAVLQEDFHSGNRVIAPAGTKVYGVVTRSAGGKRVGKQELAATLTAIRIGERLLPIVTDTAGMKAKYGGGLAKVGSGTLLGAAIGGGTGALIGGAAGRRHGDLEGAPSHRQRRHDRPGQPARAALPPVAPVRTRAARTPRRAERRRRRPVRAAPRLRAAFAAPFGSCVFSLLRRAHEAGRAARMTLHDCTMSRTCARARV